MRFDVKGAFVEATESAAWFSGFKFLPTTLQTEISPPYFADACALSTFEYGIYVIVCVCSIVVYAFRFIRKIRVRDEPPHRKKKV